MQRSSTKRCDAPREICVRPHFDTLADEGRWPPSDGETDVTRGKYEELIDRDTWAFIDRTNAMVTLGDGPLIKCHLSRDVLDEMEPVITQVRR